jgi:hypothetical protein
MEINHEGANSLELWSANECYSMFHPFIVKANFLQVRENMYQNLVKFFFFLLTLLCWYTESFSN